MTIRTNYSLYYLTLSGILLKNLLYYSIYLYPLSLYCTVHVHLLGEFGVDSLLLDLTEEGGGGGGRDDDRNGKEMNF